jgi:hypothetical protein
MPLERLIIENGLDVKGNGSVTGSVTVTQPFTNVSLSGSFTGSFQGNGTAVTGAKAIITNMPSGTVISLYRDEVEDTGTTATTVKTYTLPSNTYSRIIIESECGFRGFANANSNVTFNIVVGGVTKRTHTDEGDATGATDQQEKGRTLKYSEAITGGATIEITTTTVLNGTWEVDALRVYGVT